MKPILIPIGLCLSALLAETVSSQVVSLPVIPVGSTNSANALASILANPSTWQGAIKDWHSTEWQLPQVVTNEITGKLQLQTNHFKEVGSGLNYLGDNGWQRSADMIELMTNGGAAALRGPTKVYFSPTLGADGPTIRMVSASNVVLHVQPSAIYYVDASGASALLSTLRPDAEGELVPPNQVVYRAVTTNGISCLISYTYTHGAFESDLLILSQPSVTPDMLGLDPQTTRISLTHLINGPVPNSTPTLTSVGLIDSRLELPGLSFPQGFAFSTGGDTNALIPGTPAQVQMPGSYDGERIPVVKRIIPIGPGVWGLAEDVRWVDIKPKLDALPPYTQGASLSKPIRRASLEWPKSAPWKAKDGKQKVMKVANLAYRPKAVDLDFISIVSGSNFVFETGETYFLSSPASFNGSVDLYSCVIKETNGAYLWLTGPVNSHGTLSNPTIFTSMNDWAFGENNLPGSTGYPTFSGAPALRLGYTASPMTLNNLKIRWAQTGLQVDGNGGGITDTLLNSSLEWCQTGITNSGCTLSLQNCSKCNVTNALAGTYIGTLTDICSGTDPANGLPYTWEYAYFGTNGISAIADPDGDGFSNAQEQTNGTNPQVYDGPRIQIQPQSQTVVQGSNAVFIVGATGTATLSYQWYKGGQPISGATASSYSISNLQLANSGFYFVVVSSPYGMASSISAFLSVSTSTTGTPTPYGIVGWWPGENTANDVVNGNNGIFSGGYTNGEVNQAFNVVSAGSTVRIPAAAVLNVGASSGLTVEGWIKPWNTYGEPVFEWAPTNTFGAHVWINWAGVGSVWVNLVDTLGNYHIFQSANALISSGSFQHLAVTYDEASGYLQLFVNGSLRTNFLMGVFSPQTTPDLWLGCRPWTVDNTITYIFNGVIDEASVYNRALNTNDVQAIYTAGSYGKYLPSPPAITNQPQSATTSAGGTATFSVGASGATPLSYQWLFNGGTISGATASSYSVSNVQAGNVGVYAVVVASPRGSTLSASSFLNLTNSCTTPPSGLIDWWRAESNTTDQVGTNNGTWVGSSGYTNGEDGQAFYYSGAGSGTSYVQVANSASLQLSNAFTIEFWYFQPTGTPLASWEGAIAKRLAYPGACNFGVNIMSNTALQVYYKDPTYGGYAIASVTAVPAFGTQHHVVGTFQQIDSSHVGVAAYIDGSFAATNYSPGSLVNSVNSAPITIGASTTGSEYFGGWIDEVSLYSRVLTPTEISALWSAGASGKCCVAPVISTQPASQTVVQGNTASFNVVASGTAPLGYQWRFNGANLAGATQSTLTINNSQPANAGNYSVVVSNFVGTAASATAVLTVLSPPVITTQPTNQIAPPGANVTFTVSASGSLPLSYQWSLNGQAIVGALGSSYNISNAQSVNAGTYSVQVTNAAGSTTSANATLTLAACVNLTSNLVSWWRAEGDATDSVGGNDGRLIGGATFGTGEVGQGFSLSYPQYVQVPSSPALKLTNAFTVELWYKDTGNEWYWVSLIGKCSPTAINFDIGLFPTVNNYLAMIFTDPTTNGQNTLYYPVPTAGQFHHVAGTYQQINPTQVQMQLYIDGALKTNGTYFGNLANTVSDAPLRIGDDLPPGNFFTGIIDEVAIYSRILSSSEIASIFNAGSFGKCVPTATSPRIVVQPTSVTVTAGSDLFLSGQASGTPPLSYQWRLNGTTLIPGATNRVYIITNAQPSQSGSFYSLFVTNSLGSISSTNAVLTVNAASCIAVPSGLVAWWKAENNTLDQMGDDTGFLLNGTSYSKGMVGQGFNLPGFPNYTCVNFPSSPSLKLTNAFTVEFWYKDPNGTGGGYYAWISKDQISAPCSSTYAAGNFVMQVGGSDYYLQAGFSDANVGYQALDYWPVPLGGMFHHMAASYQQTSPSQVAVKLYIDGQSVLTNTLSGNLANTLSDVPVTIGANGADGAGGPFPGVVDEVAIYSRVLTGSEIASIYGAGAGGKCSTSNPPVITWQPANQAVAQGGEVLMSVFASGTPQLTYQWNYNGTLIPGATTKTYVINDVQPNQAGNYSVLVTNALGSVLSQAASLMVTSPPSCTQAPTNVVSWWRGEGNTIDSVGTNNGTWNGNTNYLPGKVAEGFRFDGSSYVSVSDSPSLHLSNGLTAELWYKDSGSTYNIGLIAKMYSYDPWPGFAVAIVPNAYVAVWFCDPNVRGQWIDYSPVPAAGMFHHLAVTYQQQANQVIANLYIDGQCARSGMTWNGYLTNALSANVPLTIGAIDNAGDWPFNGIIDEPTVYNRTLSSSEIQAIYTAGASGKCTASSYGALSVSITTPTNLQQFVEVTNVALQAVVSDNVGTVTNVQFYLGPIATTNLIGAATKAVTNGAYYNFNWTNRWYGNYPVTALAVDNVGASNVSSAVLFTVNPTNNPPVVNVTYPNNNAVFAAGSDITITATATPGTLGGNVTNVAFYVNRVLLGNDSQNPYSITKCCWSPGTYSLIAEATDSLGAVGVSSNTITIGVGAANENSGNGYWDSLFGNPGVSHSMVTAMRVVGTNLYIAGPGLWNVNGTSSTALAVWNGTSWQDMNSGTLSLNTHVIQSDGTTLYAAGDLVSGTEPNPAFWTSTNWMQLGAQQLNEIRAMTIMGSDVYIAGGFLNAGTNSAQYVARYNPSTTNWDPVGNGLDGPVFVMANLGGSLYIGGTFTNAGGNSNARGIAKLQGTNWVAIGSGVSGNNSWGDPGGVFALAACGNSLFVGGDFASAGGNTNANGIAVWDGNQWLAVQRGFTGNDVDSSAIYWGGGLTNRPPKMRVFSIVAMGNTFYAGGEFRQALQGTNLTVNHIAKAVWSDDAQNWVWTDLDRGLINDFGEDFVLCMAAMPGIAPGAYDLFVGGSFDLVGSAKAFSRNIARWSVGAPYPTNAQTVTITSPLGGALFTNSPTAAIALSAITRTTNGGYTSVQFYIDGVTNGVTTLSPFTASNNASSGSHIVTALVSDYINYNYTAAAASPVLFTVKPSSAPSIDAVNDSYIVFANSGPNYLPVLANDQPSTGLKISDVNPSIEGAFGQPLIAAFGGSPMGIVSVSPDQQFVIYTPTANFYGTNLISYSITNSSGSDHAFVTIKIAAKPFVQITNPPGLLIMSNSASVAISGTAIDYDGTVTNLTICTNGVAWVTFTPSGILFSTNWSQSNPGFYTFTAIAQDNDGYSNVSQSVTVQIKNTSLGVNYPIAYIISPTESLTNAGPLVTPVYPIINGIFSVTGRAYSPDNAPVAWQVVLLDPTNPTNVLYNITPGTLNSQGFRTDPVVSGSFATNFDISLVQNGTYLMRLIVQSEGLQSTFDVHIHVVSNLKVGQFSFSEQDLVIPVNGIPLTVTRTYNSLNPLSSDFGYSWTYSLDSMDVQIDEQRTNVIVGNPPVLDGFPEWDSNGLPLATSIRTGGNLDVTLNLPDGRRTTFYFTPQFEPGLSQAQASWTAAPDVHATLGVYPAGSATINFLNAYAFWQDGGDGSSFDIHDIPGFALTNYDGTVYFLTRGSPALVYYTPSAANPGVWVNTYGQPKLTGILQRSGDQIIIGGSGISHKNPSGLPTHTVWFDRDSQNRIIAIHDPVGGSNAPPVVKYIYGQITGNLIEVLKLVDRSAGTYATNKYQYYNSQFPHYITEIDNGIGVPITRNIYDSSGRLIATVDANNNTNQFIHNLINSTELVIDRLGRTNTYVYDTRGNVTAITNALKGITISAYDTNNNKIIEIVYTNGAPYATNTFGYDLTKGVLLATTNALGFTNGFAYNSFEQLTNTIDALGGSSTNYYDAITGNLVGTSDALGNPTTYFYDGNGFLIGSKDAIGTLTTNYYDNLGNLTNTAMLSSSGTILSTNNFGYDLDGNRTNSTVWRRVSGNWSNAVTSFIYDGQNRVVQTIDPDLGTNIVVFDTVGRQQQTINKRGWAMTYSYDALNRLIMITFPDSSSIANTYDANGNRLTSVDQLGRTNTYSYDALNRLFVIKYPDGATNLTVYDDLGRVKFSVDGRGFTNAFGYDVGGRRVAVTNAWGTSVALTNLFGFDANGNQTYFTNSSWIVTSYAYDSLNRQTNISLPDGMKQMTAYDAAARRILVTDQAGIKTAYGYDGLGRLTSMTNALGVSNQQVYAQYQYDEAGNETAQIDALNRTTIFAYDSMGRRMARTLPAGGAPEGFTYDSLGNILYHTNFNGKTITNVYDKLNRLLVRLYPDGTSISNTYSLTGRRLTVKDSSGSYTNVYDSRERLTTYRTPIASINYGYDANGNVTNISSSTPNGTSVTYQYDALNRLNSVTDMGLSGNQNTAYTYDSAGNLKWINYPNTVTNSYQYDSLNRLTGLLWVQGSGTTNANFSYQLGVAGNRTNVTETVGSAIRGYSWQYDSLYRLTNENITGAGPIGNLGYSYDAVGNRTSRTGSVGPLSPQSFTYTSNDYISGDSFDADGNTINDGGAYYYDYEDRVIGYSSISVGYNADGQMVKRADSSSTTLYLVDVVNPTGYPQVLEEFNVNGTTNLAAVYTYGPNRISVRQPNVTTNFYGFDGHGSTRFLMNSAGGITENYVYEAFGRLISGGTSINNNFWYSGEYHDSSLGLYYLRARHYNAGTGRFFTLDTFEGSQEDPLSLHKYLYCSANPVNRVDPSGHDGDLVSLMMSTSLGVGLDSMYNGGVVTVGNALQKTIIGVQNGETVNAILGSYLKDVAIGVGIGVAIGAVADIAGDLVYGGNVEGEVVEVEVNTPTFSASQNFARTESATKDLMAAVGRAGKTIGPGKGPVYGTKYHVEFEREANALGYEHTEVAYKNGVEVTPGTPGSVEVDVAVGERASPQAIYDLKTGSAKLTPSRIAKLRQHVPNGQNIPIIELKPSGRITTY